MYSGSTELNRAAAPTSWTSSGVERTNSVTARTGSVTNLLGARPATATASPSTAATRVPSTVASRVTLNPFSRSGRDSLTAFQSKPFTGHLPRSPSTRCGS